jgi:hypothetical protein
MAKKLPSEKANVSATKAKQILSDGETRGNPLSQAQKGLFGAIAGGAPTKAKGPATKAPAKKASKAPPRKAQGPGIGGLAIGQRRRGGMMPPPLA